MCSSDALLGNYEIDQQTNGQTHAKWFSVLHYIYQLTQSCHFYRNYSQNVTKV